MTQLTLKTQLQLPTPIQSSQEIHDQKVQELANRYLKEGYQVIVEPTKTQLPFDLAGYCPNLIAQNDSQGVIVEVKLRSSRKAIDSLQKAVNEVRKHQGWRFLLITADDVLPNNLPGIDPELLSWDRVKDWVDRAAHLKTLGETEAAYLLLWIAFEHMMRLKVHEILPLLDRLSTTILIRELDDYDELSLEQYDQAIALQETHHLVVHGVPVPDLAQKFDLLRELVQDRAIAWRNPSEGP